MFFYSSHKNGWLLLLLLVLLHKINFISADTANSVPSILWWMINDVGQRRVENSSVQLVRCSVYVYVYNLCHTPIAIIMMTENCYFGSLEQSSVIPFHASFPGRRQHLAGHWFKPQTLSISCINTNTQWACVVPMYSASFFPALYSSGKLTTKLIILICEWKLPIDRIQLAFAHATHFALENPYSCSTASWMWCSLFTCGQHRVTAFCRFCQSTATYMEWLYEALSFLSERRWYSAVGDVVRWDQRGRCVYW